jgi:hypothetical protein
MDGDLARAWKRIKKRRGWDDSAGIAADLRDVMIRCSPIPHDMAEEIAAFFLDEPIDEESVYKSQEILEILEGTWISRDSALTDDDWDFLKEQVNAWALDMDMGIVTGVMKLVVDRGGFGRSGNT